MTSNYSSQINPKSFLIALAISESGSLNRAADVLRTSQPSLSRTIQELELRVGMKIFERGPNGMTPTEGGLSLLHHARNIRAELHRAELELENLINTEKHFLTIGTAPIQPPHLAAKAMLKLLGELPNVHVDLEVKLPDGFIECLLAGEVDFAIVAIHQKPPTPGITEEVWYHDRTAVVARANHPLTWEKNVSVPDLKKYPWTLGPPGNLVRNHVEILFHNEDEELPEIAFVSEDIPIRKSTIQQSDYLSSFRRDQVQFEVTDGQLSIIDVSWDSDQLPVGIMRRSSSTPSPIEIRAMEIFREIFSEAGFNMTPAGSKPGRGN